MKRFASLTAAAGAVAAISASALAGGAGAASSLPTVNVSETGTTGISMSTTTVPSGAVQFVVTHSGKGGGNGPSFGIIRLNPGVTPQQAFQAVGSHHGNLDALTSLGALIVGASAPGTVQTVLTPGTNYYAVNTTGNGGPSVAHFTVTQSSSPAALPAAAATQKSIEFGFKGPKVLKNGTMVRSENAGYLVHMIILDGVKSKAAGLKEIAGLRAGKPQRFFRQFETGRFVSLLNPASPGAMQQAVLHTKPGFYVEACFMDTQDGREHTKLGMERLVKVVK